MQLKIDNREHTLIQLLNALIKTYNLDITLNVENLPLGDIIFYDDTKCEDVVIIERKSLSDLASSIKDGRYAEQSLRLAHLDIPNHNIYYLIEGNMDAYNSKYTRVTPSTLYSSMFSIQYYKGFSLMRSFDIQETAEIILRFYIKCNRDTTKKPYYNNCEQTITTNQTPYTEAIHYTQVIKKVKKENIVPENIGGIILSQIPGISFTISKVVMDTYGSLYNLLMELSKNSNCLNDLQYTTKNGQVRRVSHKAIKSIKEYLLYKKENTIEINTAE